MRYPDHANPDLLIRIPLDARTVLDVGCAAGALGAAYARLNPAATVYGIDADAGAVAVAASRGLRTACADAEAEADPFPDAPAFDAIVFGDVLEHLREPFAVLARYAARLAPDGTILICVPNVEHWSFAARLLAGTWDYEPDGLLDRTHLRWFTLDTMRQGLLAAGLQPCDVRPRIFGADQGAAFVAALTPGLQALGIDPQHYADRAMPLQYVWRAQTAPRRRLGLAATMLAPVGGVSDLRVVYPMQALGTDPTIVTSIVGKIEDAPHWPADLPKVLVVHRPVLRGPQALAELRRLYAANWVVVTEFDDHPEYFPALEGPEQYGFSAVHALQTTTVPLAEILLRHNPEVAVFANAVRELPEPRNFATPGQLTLFFGALNREQDWPAYVPALNAVAAEAGERLRFVVVHDRGFFDALATPHKSFAPMCEHDVYMRLMGGCELVFLPLRDTPFNRAKSDLKYVEAASVRACGLASPCVYAGSIAHGRTGLIVETPDTLAATLRRLLSDTTLARTLAEAAREEIGRTRLQAQQMPPRRAWYWSLWDRREALAEAAYERVPELRPEP